MPSIGIFDRLGFPASMSNNTIEFSENTQKSLANLPPILATWQMEDIANSATTGYFENPVSSYTANILSTIQSIELTSNTSNLTSIYSTANSVLSSNNLSEFIAHTNRISGVSPIDPENSLLPQYNNCIGIGKALTYIIYQSDGISNNAVLMGNFGSLYTANSLQEYSSNLANDLILIQNSISSGNSNLTANQISSINYNITTSNTFIYNSMMQDITFYNNSRAVIDDYNAVKGFGHMGDTEKYLANTLIGTDKLKERIF